MFYLAIILAFCILPALFLGGIQGGIAAIVQAPRIASRFGIQASPLAARLIMAALIFVPLSLFWPKMALFIAGLAALFLPLAIVVILAIAALTGMAAGAGKSGDAFWRAARPVPLLCVAFAVAVIPIAIAKYRATETYASRPLSG